MIHILDPWDSKNSLRNALLTLKEDKGLDSLIEDYVREILGHKIVMRPSKGPYGEKGKDIVAVENEETGNYCSFIVKRGNLQEHLDGKFGILRQMTMAMLTDLEIDKYRGKKRSAVVVHNGGEGYRGAIPRYEKHRKKIEKKCGVRLLRPIERWDIDELVNRLFDYGDILKKNAEIDQVSKKRGKLDEAAAIFVKEFENTLRLPVATQSQAVLAKKFYERCKKIEYMHGRYNKKLRKL